jgi:hypothetical protein
LLVELGLVFDAVDESRASLANKVFQWPSSHKGQRFRFYELLKSSNTQNYIPEFFPALSQREFDHGTRSPLSRRRSTPCMGEISVCDFSG